MIRRLKWILIAAEAWGWRRKGRWALLPCSLRWRRGCPDSRIRWPSAAQQRDARRLRAPPPELSSPDPTAEAEMRTAF